MATYQVLWLPRDTDNSMPAATEPLMIEAGEAVRWEDVLGQAFGVDDGTNAVGALAFISDSSDLKFFSRTYNQTLEGTFGQAIPGFAADELIPSGEMKRILFFTENSDYRSNIGILNGTGAPMTIQWRRYIADGTMVDEAEARPAAVGQRPAQPGLFRRGPGGRWIHRRVDRDRGRGLHGLRLGARQRLLRSDDGAAAVTHNHGSNAKGGLGPLFLIED